MASSRREFITQDLLGVILEVKELLSFDFTEDEQKGAEKKDYFTSFESCYAFLAEVPLEDLQNAALEKGIAIEGKTKFQLAKELYS